MSNPRVTEPWKLLPINSTQLERDILKTLPLSEEANAIIARLGSIKYDDIPDDFLPWVVLENGLLWARDFLANDQEVLDKGIPLNKLKGTPWAVKEILRWFGYENPSVREADRPLLHFAEFEVDPGDVIENLALILKIYQAMQHVIPARSRFRRIFHGYDRRVFYIGESQMGREFLNHPSGILYDSLGYGQEKTGLLVSFGRTHSDDVQHDVGPIVDHYYRENFYRFAGYTEPHFPSLSEEFEGRFYDPRLSVLEGWGRSSASMVLQPVAGWEEMCWDNLAWEQHEVLDKHETIVLGWNDGDTWDDDDSWED